MIKILKPLKVRIDIFLDHYNNYKYLYEIFGEEEYKNKMDLALTLLKETVKKG